MLSVHGCVCVCVRICVYVFTDVFPYICICMYVFTHIRGPEWGFLILTVSSAYGPWYLVSLAGAGRPGADLSRGP